MTHNLKPGQLLTTLLQQIAAYDQAKDTYALAGSQLWNTLSSWAMRQEDPTDAYVWLRSQPFAQVGVTLPQEVIDQLPQPEATLE